MGTKTVNHYMISSANTTKQLVSFQYDKQSIMRNYVRCSGVVSPTFKYRALKQSPLVSM